MNAEPCPDRALLIQADHDGELSPAEAAQLQVHLRDCAGCRAQAAFLRDLSTRLHAEVPISADSAVAAGRSRRSFAIPSSRGNAVTRMASAVDRFSGRPVIRVGACPGLDPIDQDSDGPARNSAG